MVNRTRAFVNRVILPRMRRVLVLAALVLLAPATIAWADEQMTASFNNRFDQTTVTIDQGERLTFRNNDVKQHDVTSEAPGDVNGHLFQSELIGTNQSSPVAGVEHLTTGDYRFICSVHPEMKGTLVVTSAGTPVPRPGSGGGADTLPPVVELSGGRPRASKLRSRRRVTVKLGSSEAGTFVLTSGKARKEGSIGPEVIRVTLGFSRRAARRFDKGDRLRLTAAVTDAAGNTGADKLTLKLR